MEPQGISSTAGPAAAPAAGSQGSPWFSAHLATPSLNPGLIVGWAGAECSQSQPRGPGQQFLALPRADLHLLWSHQPTLRNSSASPLTPFQDAAFWRLQRDRKSAQFAEEENIE